MKGRRCHGAACIANREARTLHAQRLLVDDGDAIQFRAQDPQLMPLLVHLFASELRRGLLLIVVGLLLRSGCHGQTHLQLWRGGKELA